MEVSSPSFSSINSEFLEAEGSEIHVLVRTCVTDGGVSLYALLR